MFQTLCQRNIKRLTGEEVVIKTYLERYSGLEKLINEAIDDFVSSRNLDRTEINVNKRLLRKLYQSLKKGESATFSISFLNACSIFISNQLYEDFLSKHTHPASEKEDNSIQTAPLKSLILYGAIVGFFYLYIDDFV